MLMYVLMTYIHDMNIFVSVHHVMSYEHHRMSLWFSLVLISIVNEQGGVCQYAVEVMMYSVATCKHVI